MLMKVPRYCQAFGPFPAQYQLPHHLQRTDWSWRKETPHRLPRLNPSASLGTYPPLSGAAATGRASGASQGGVSLTRRWWTPGGLCLVRQSRRSWPARPSASSGAATKSSASRRRAGGRRALTRSSSASAFAPPSGCSRRWGHSPRTPSRRPASPSAASPSSTPAPTPARAPSASTSTRYPTGTTSASRGARASASSSPLPSCSGHVVLPLGATPSGSSPQFVNRNAVFPPYHDLGTRHR